MVKARKPRIVSGSSQRRGGACGIGLRINSEYAPAAILHLDIRLLDRPSYLHFISSIKTMVHFRTDIGATNEAAVPNSENYAKELETDVLIVGAGFGGIYLMHKLRQLGFNCKIFEAVRKLIVELCANRSLTMRLSLGNQHRRHLALELLSWS
jgi:hypothetical protein